MGTSKRKVVIDTNVLIDSPEVLLNGVYDYVLPYVVLQELDGLKKNPDLNVAVRFAIKIIYQQMKLGELEVVGVPTNAKTNDEKIVAHASNDAEGILTGDIGARAVALFMGVPVVDDENDSEIDDTYEGFTEVYSDQSYENIVSHKTKTVEEFEERFDVNIGMNTYVIVNRVNGKTDIWVEQLSKDGENGARVMSRVSQSAKPVKDAGIMITALDAFQQAAWHAVTSDVPLTVLEGKVGSSKTLSALVGLLVRTRGQKGLQKFSKIYYSRAPIPVDKSLKMGYMPGDMADKAHQWIAGISSNLKFIYGDKEGERVLKDYFEFVSLESIQGLSLQEDEALLIDEYQLLSKDMLKQILTRVGEGGKVVLAGDPSGQTYGANRGREGFKVLQRVFGKVPFINYVQLNSVYRSKFVEFIDKLFDGLL